MSTTSVIALTVLLQVSPSDGWERFLFSNYSEDNARYADGYERRATNRFGAASGARMVEVLPALAQTERYVVEGGERWVDGPGGRRPVQLLPEASAALGELLASRPDLAPLAAQLYPEERVRYGDARISTAFLSEARGSAPTGAAPLHLLPLVYCNGEACAATVDQPARVDPENAREVDAHGGYRQRVWDVIDLGGARYIVVLQDDYEARCFQVYRLEGRVLARVAHVSFACLGC